MVFHKCPPASDTLLSYAGLSSFPPCCYMLDYPAYTLILCLLWYTLAPTALVHHLHSASGGCSAAVSPSVVVPFYFILFLQHETFTQWFISEAPLTSWRLIMMPYSSNQSSTSVCVCVAAWQWHHYCTSLIPACNSILLWLTGTSPEILFFCHIRRWVFKYQYFHDTHTFIYLK